MTFDRTWTNLARLSLLCCLVSACGNGGESARPAAITPEQRFHVAGAAEASGNLVVARSMYAAAAAETQGDRTMQLRAAEGLTRTGAPGDAIGVLQDYLRRRPNDQDVRAALGKLQIMNGSPADAVATLSVVLAARPGDDTVRINKGVALDILARHAEAQQLYREALTRNASDTEAANDLALSLMLTGQVAEARVIVAPFRTRGDLPERMRTTIATVDAAPGPVPVGAADTRSVPSSPPPTSLSAPAQKKTKPQAAAVPGR